MKSKKILIIDDETDFAATLEERLIIRNYECRSTSGYAEAEMLFDQGWLPDVIILDYKMPGIDGRAALRLIRQKSPAIAVIMLTGHGSIDSAVEEMKRDLTDYLLKPADIEELVLRIEQATATKPADKTGP